MGNEDKRERNEIKAEGGKIRLTLRKKEVGDA